MSLFAYENQKLFNEIDERFSRQDEWSEPKSVSVGWPLTQHITPEDYREYASRYYEAMRSLCSDVCRNNIEDFVASFPIIFLFRHSVELALKAIVHNQSGSAPGGHDLSRLLARVERLPHWAHAWISELHRLDERSTGLRYPDAEVGFFEMGSLMHDWLAKTEALHVVLMGLSQTRPSESSVST